MLPVSQGFAQLTDTPSSLGVKLVGNTFSYRDSEGYTIVLGEVENTKNFPVTNVKIWVGFYADKSSGNSSPLETTTGTTLLGSVQPHGKSPFMIKSQTPDPEISQITINMLGFNSASPKQQLLEIAPGTASISENFTMSGTITNKGQGTSTHARIHLISYDAFSPPRIVGIHTISVDDLKANTTYDFAFDTAVDPRATSFKVLAEADNYQSKSTDVTHVSVDVLTRLITINDVRVIDSSGNGTLKLHVGEPVDITSALSIQATTSGAQPFVYYAQVKQFGEKGTVEFLGVSDGIFNSTQMQTAKVTWTPESEGGFFIETFVWDPSGAALAAPSSTVSIILVAP
jgi:hypothetical protein